jgi:DNA-binding NtrC family response regulator
MSLEHSGVISPPRFPRLLIVEDNVSITTRLIRTLEDRRLHLGFDLCTSHRQAVSQLVASPYQVIIGNAHLAEMDDRLLLNRIDLLQGSVPLVITASPFEKECARRVLEQRAFDLIPTPIDHEQAVSPILLALRQSKVANLIASKDKTMEKYREHRTAYPSGNEMDAFFIKTLSAIDASIRAYEKTLGGVEASAMGFSNVAKAMEYRTKQRALARLDLFGRKAF